MMSRLSEFSNFPDVDLPALPPENTEGEKTVKAKTVSLEFLDADSRQTTYPLKYPFRLHGEVVKVITLRRLTLAEVAQIDQQLEGQMVSFNTFRAAICGLTIEVFNSLDIDDAEELINRATPFLPRLALEPQTPEPGDATP